jgi:hypothetical protein
MLPWGKNVKVNNYIFFFFLFAFIQENVLAGALKCSRNGTELIYINGMDNTRTDANLTLEEIDKQVKLFKSSIDTKPELISVSNIVNPSHGIGNDIIEHVLDVAYTAGISEPWKYLRAVSISDKIDSIIKTRTNFLPSTFTNFDKLALYKIRGAYSEYFTSAEVLQASNVKVKNELRSSIIAKLVNNKKILLIAHSQGNSITKAATADLPTLIDDENKVRKYMGTLHVATPIRDRATVKSRLIKLSTDRVVGYLYGVSESANYELDSGSTEWTNHGMSNTYLSSSAMAHKIGTTDTPSSMLKIFQNNLIELAQELEDNCDVPNIKISSNEMSQDPLTNQFFVEGYAGNSRKILLKITDDSGDRNKDGIDENGYDRNLTEYTYRFETKYPPLMIELDSPIEGAFKGDGEIEIALPYRDLEYKLTVTAKNQFGKESRIERGFLIPANKAPTATISDQVCRIDSHGFNAKGGMTYKLTYVDDAYLVDGRVLNNYLEKESEEFPLSDGVNSNIIEVVNQCLVIPVRYNWEIRATCQGGGCDRSAEPDCNHYVNTGVQSNIIYTFYATDNEPAYRLHGAEGHYGHSITGGFVDPNDSSKMISYPTAELCVTNDFNDGVSTETVIKSN